VAPFDILPSWRDHVLSYVDLAKLKPLSIVCNGGNGGAGTVLDLLEKQLPFRFTKVHHQPDGDFPNGVPNPMLEENQEVTGRQVRLARADLGIAFDGDFDRCFFFDEEGRFIDGYYIVGLLASTFLDQGKGAPIVHDPRVVWNTQQIVRPGRPPGAVQVRPCLHEALHARSGYDLWRRNERPPLFPQFRLLRQRDDSVVVMAQHLSRTGKTLSSLVDERMKLFPSSGEINRKIGDVKGAVEAVGNATSRVRSRSRRGRPFDRAHTLALQPPQLNTEPLVRLNVESRGGVPLMKEDRGNPRVAPAASAEREFTAPSA
jgi:phosphomannomutase